MIHAPGNAGGGEGSHVEVRQGDCISSIALENGHFWETIWNHSANAQLREQRGDPNVLLPGDRVFVPAKQTKEESCQTDQTHRFRRRGEPTKLRLRLLSDSGRPRARETYRLIVDGRHRHDGQTDADGRIEHFIAGNSASAKLYVGPENQEYQLLLGHVDPVSEISGVQARLRNLGYNPGEIDGRMGPETRAALEQFQTDRDIQVTGRPDQATRDALEQAHGC